MKLFLAAMALLAAASVRAQYVPSAPSDDSMEANALYRTAPSRGAFLALQPQPANQVTINGRTYSGSLVQLVKTQQPLEMVNPAAPPEFGSWEDNTVIDFSGRANGLKFFSIQF